MIELSPLALEMRRAYYRQYRQKKLKQHSPEPAANVTGERDRRYWEKKADDYLAELAASGMAEQAETVKNCPSAADFDEYWKKGSQNPTLKT